MNQILSVDNNNSNNNNNYNNNGYGNGKKPELKTVIIFFCVILIIFGVFIIGNGAYSIKNKSSDGENVANQPSATSSEEPEVVVQVVSDIEIKLIIAHNKVINKVEYGWNDEEPIEQIGNGNKNFEISNIEVPPGDNELKIKITDEDDVETIVSKTCSSPERPWIKLSSEANAIKVEIESKIGITQVTYYWDNEQPKTSNLNTMKTMKTLELTEPGEHTLHITAIDQEGNEATKTRKIKVVRAPEVKVTTDGENFIIRASDEEEIAKIVINLNGNTSEDEINQKEYESRMKLADGENRIIVTVYNKNGITKQAKLKWTKE